LKRFLAPMRGAPQEAKRGGANELDK
jgi:hypothetical protein